MKATIINFQQYKSSFPSMAAGRFWSTWGFPVQLGMLLCPLLLMAPHAWGQPGPVTYSIWNDSTVPSTLSEADAQGVELGLKFRSAADGFIMGIRFYKGPGNTGTHVGNLWTSTGTLLGSVTFANETASGWQQQALASPVPIRSNTTYVVSYYAPAGGYAVNWGFFTNSGVDTPPLRALAEGEDGPDGVYAYSAVSVFPTQTYQSANYWVDVVFEEQQADTNLPTFSIWNDSTVPSILSEADPLAVELGLKFRSAVNGNVTGIRFYKGSGNTGTHVGNLWSSTGTRLGSVTFANETASGWQQQALPSPVPINANTTYVVSYYAPAGGYAVNWGFFTNSGVDTPPLRALADGEDGPNGVYAYSAVSVFPTQAYQSGNYWVDVVLAENRVDTNPPTITCPGDVILQCASCNTDPSNAGTATATDDSGSARVTCSDAVSGVCPRVVKRTWTATDAAGNAASCIQTITCLPPSLMTKGSRCVFDRDPTTGVQDFRLLFIQDPQNWPCFRIAASNPGQFFYNVFYTGSPGQQVTFNITLPYPFVTQGANPIHAYDWVTVMGEGAQQCLAPGNVFFVSSQQVGLAGYGTAPAAFTTIPVTLRVPASGVVYLAMHLDYGLTKASGYTKNLVDDAVSCAVSTRVLIPNHGSYNFFVGGAQNGATSIQNYNSFKRIPGVAGLVQHKDTLDPVPGAVVTLMNANHVRVGFAVTDEDGFYMIAYKNTGKAATFYLSVATPPPAPFTATQATTLKANAFVRVDFLVP
jgi:hypothetical protein